jgi:hypothetical protein
MVKYNNGTGLQVMKLEEIFYNRTDLIKPAYRCYVLLNLENEDEKALYGNIMFIS